VPVGYDAVIKDSQNNASGPESYNFAHSNHGQIYLTVGGGGGPLYSCTTTAGWLIRCDSQYSFAKFTINGDTLTMQALKADGAVLDDGFTISKTRVTTLTLDLKEDGSDSSVNLLGPASYTLGWMRAKATACAAPGKWSGSKLLSGSDFFSP
jgi:hypothetical protein